MKRLLLSVGVLTMLAVPAVSFAGNNYNPNPNASDCGRYHGAFGAFGKDNNFAGGADGQATGAANSAKGCQTNL